MLEKSTILFHFDLLICSYDFNIYIWYQVPFQIPILFVWCRFSFKVIIACTKHTIKILNVMVFHSINLVLMHIWIQNIQLKCYINCFVHINVMFHFLGQFTHMLFEPFIWINIMPNVYFVIVLTFNVIHKMLLYLIQRPFFVGTLCF
jgi:hypothetical protein